MPPKVTPNSVGGIGGWTLDDLAVAVRQGVSPEGRPYDPAFPYNSHAGLSDQDVADLWAAIQAMPAPARDVTFPFKLRFGPKLWRAAFLDPPVDSPVLGRSQAWSRGQQIEEGPAHRTARHTGRNLLGGLKPGEFMAGNDSLPGGSVARSIRAEDLRAWRWTAASLAYALRTGMTPDGDAFGGSMAEVVRAGTSCLDGAHREAIAAHGFDVDDAAPAQEAPSVAGDDEVMGDMEGMDGMED